MLNQPTMKLTREPANKAHVEAAMILIRARFAPSWGFD